MCVVRLWNFTKNVSAGLPVFARGCVVDVDVVITPGDTVGLEFGVGWVVGRCVCFVRGHEIEVAHENNFLSEWVPLCSKRSSPDGVDNVVGLSATKPVVVYQEVSSEMTAFDAFEFGYSARDDGVKCEGLGWFVGRLVDVERFQAAVDKRVGVGCGACIVGLS